MKILVFVLILTSYVYSAQWAYVVTERAIVYADKNMTSEIGYISRGKKIRVGEVARNRGTVIPLVINDRVVYIKLKDINTSKNEKLMVNSTNRKEIIDQVKEISRMGLSYSHFLPSLTEIDESENSEMSFSGFILKGYRIDKTSRFTYGAELEFLYGLSADEKNEYKLYIFSGEVLYRLIDFNNLTFSALAGVSIIPLSQYSYDNLFTANSAGLGGYVGLEVFTGFSESFGLHAIFKYRYLNLLGYDVPRGDQTEDFSKTYSPSLSGFNIQGAITYAF